MYSYEEHLIFPYFHPAKSLRKEKRIYEFFEIFDTKLLKANSMFHERELSKIVFQTN